MAAAGTNGAAGQMPAFYQGDLFTVNMNELPEHASASTIAHNGSINEIYATNDLDDEQDFFPVIDAIQGEDFNPLWLQNLIVFNRGSLLTSSPPKTRFSPRRPVRTRRSPSW